MKLLSYSLTFVTIVSSISVASLATCGIVGGIQEGDGTKVAVTIMWLVTILQYLMWKRRALIGEARARDFIDFMLGISKEVKEEQSK